MNEALLSRARSEFHAGLLDKTLTIDGDGIASNADKGNAQSRAYAAHIAAALKQETVHERNAGQTLGGSFEKAVVGFLQETFPHFGALRPGTWDIRNLG
ncbi:NgoMIV family type II restriction endonuclease, partial [Corynebacterium dentalis]|uniref:NgoMIV family type II restriction endonuclease n=1 Tax=Corynebacterium dentalis TaxID=2014528 RepID=UPI0028A21AE9